MCHIINDHRRDKQISKENFQYNNILLIIFNQFEIPLRNEQKQ